MRLKLMEYATWINRKKPQFLKIEIRAKNRQTSQNCIGIWKFCHFCECSRKKIASWNQPQLYPILIQFFIKWGLHCIARICTAINTYMGHRFKTSLELTIQCDIPLGWAHPHSIGFLSIIVHTHMSFEAYALHLCWMC